MIVPDAPGADAGKAGEFSTVAIGAASFCCLGYVLTSLIRNEDAALPPPGRSCCRSGG